MKKHILFTIFCLCSLTIKASLTSKFSNNPEFLQAIEEDDCKKLIIAFNLKENSTIPDSDFFILITDAIKLNKKKCFNFLMTHKQVLTILNKQDSLGCTALFLAAYNNRPEMLKALLEKGANPTIQGIKSLTPLMISIIQNNKDSFDLLMTNKQVLAELDTKDALGSTAVLLAAYNNRPEMLKALLERDANPTIPEPNGFTPLIASILQNNKNCFDLLMTNKQVLAELDTKDFQNKYTAICHATDNNRSEMLKTLLEKGANPIIPEPTGFTPLMISIIKNKKDSFDLLITNKQVLAELNQEGPQGLTAIFWTIKHNRLEMLKTLLEKGADPIIQSINGITPLMLSIIENNKDCFDLLMTNKQVLAEIDKKDHKGSTAVILAIYMNRPEMLKILLEQGANPTIPDENGITPLMASILQNNKNCFDLLMTNKQVLAELDTKDFQNKYTAICHATDNNRSEMLKTLLEKGANPIIPEPTGFTPLMISIIKNNKDCFNLLITNPKIIAALALAKEHLILYICSAIYKKQEYPFKQLITFLDPAKNNINNYHLLLYSIQENLNTRWLESLLDIGLNPNMQDTRGETVLMRALLNNNLNAAMILLNHPAIDVDLIDNNGNNALMIALQEGFSKIVLTLMPKTNLLQQNLEGKNAAILALEANKIKIFNAILDQIKSLLPSDKFSTFADETTHQIKINSIIENSIKTQALDILKAAKKTEPSTSSEKPIISPLNPESLQTQQESSKTPKSTQKLTPKSTQKTQPSPKILPAVAQAVSPLDAIKSIANQDSIFPKDALQCQAALDIILKNQVNLHLDATDLKSIFTFNILKEWNNLKNVEVDWHHILNIIPTINTDQSELHITFKGGHRYASIANLLKSNLVKEYKQQEIDKNNLCVLWFLKNNITGQKFTKTTFPEKITIRRIISLLLSSTLVKKSNNESEEIQTYTLKSPDSYLLDESGTKYTAPIFMECLIKKPTDPKTQNYKIITFYPVVPS